MEGIQNVEELQREWKKKDWKKESIYETSRDLQEVPEVEGERGKKRRGQNVTYLDKPAPGSPADGGTPR